MGKHGQGPYSSISCLADLLILHLRGTGRCPASSGIMLWPRGCWTCGSLAQVRHRKGTSHHSVCQGQKCPLPPQTICSSHLIPVCCAAELFAVLSWLLAPAAARASAQSHLTPPASFPLVQPLILKPDDGHKLGGYSINHLKTNEYKLSIMIVPPIIEPSLFAKCYGYSCSLQTYCNLLQFCHHFSNNLSVIKLFNQYDDNNNYFRENQASQNNKYILIFVLW